MQRDVKIGMPVVYQAGEGDPPMSNIPGRRHPALVTSVEGDKISVVIFPFNRYDHTYRGVVPRGKPDSEQACWYFPEES